MYRAKTNIWDMDYTDNYEKICAFIENKRNKILQIKKAYNIIKEVLKKYVEATEKYYKKLSSIALELKPSSESIEGQLIQAIQSIILFNSVSLDNLVNNIQEILKNLKASKELNSSALEEFSKMYQIHFSNIVHLYCKFIDENESYEKYLIHKELGILDNEKKMNNNNNDSDIKKKESENGIIKHETDKGENVEEIRKKSNNLKIKKYNSREEKIKEKIKVKMKLFKKKSLKEEKEKEKVNDTPRDDEEKINEKESKESKEIIYDNHENIFKIEKEYVDYVNETNTLIKKLMEFGCNEEKILKGDFYNNSYNFIGKLLECVDNQKKQYNEQYLIIKDLRKKIKSETIEYYFLESQQYSLHSLSIYMNNNTKNNGNKMEFKQKGEFDNEIYKQLNIENIGNIIKEMQKNGIAVKKEDLENYEREKNIAFIEKNTKLVFNSETDFSIPEEEKNKIIELFKQDKEYILFFLQKLNNDRARGDEITNMETFYRLGDLFKFISNIILNNNDYDCFKYISILSMTYFRMDGDKKIYIYNFIRDHSKLKNVDFWGKYLDNMINYDINNEIYKNKKNLEIDEKEQEFTINFATFSNVLSVVNNMTDFGLEKEFIENFLDFVKKKYTNLTSNQLKEFNYLLVLYEEKNKDIKKDINNNINNNKDIDKNNNKLNENKKTNNEQIEQKDNKINVDGNNKDIKNDKDNNKSNEYEEDMK